MRWQEEYEQSLKDSETEQAKIDQDTDATLKADAEIMSCEPGQCQADDMTCHDVNKDEGPYLADDLVSCTDTKPEDQAYAGETWAGIPAPPPLAPIPDPSPECVAKHDAFDPTEYGQLVAANPMQCPAQVIACHNASDYAAKKQVSA